MSWDPEGCPMNWSRGSDDEEVGIGNEELKSGKELSQPWPPGWVKPPGPFTDSLAASYFHPWGCVSNDYFIKWLFRTLSIFTYRGSLYIVVKALRSCHRNPFNLCHWNVLPSALTPQKYFSRPGQTIPTLITFTPFYPSPYTIVSLLLLSLCHCFLIRFSSFLFYPSADCESLEGRSDVTRWL